MKHLLLNILIFWSSYYLFSQDSDAFRKYSFIQSIIVANKIKSITEISCCRPEYDFFNESKKNKTSKYEFDINGRITSITIFRSDSTPFFKTTYISNNIDFTIKHKDFFDSIGNIESQHDWKFIFDSNGRKSEAKCYNKKVNFMTYKYVYDNKSNLIEEYIHIDISSKITYFTLKYDSLNNLINREEGLIYEDSTKHQNTVTTYAYNDKNMIIQETTNSIYGKIYRKSYLYNNSNQLISFITEKYSDEISENNLSKKYIYKYEYDNKGNLQNINVITNKGELINCFSYINEFY